MFLSRQFKITSSLKTFLNVALIRREVSSQKAVSFSEKREDIYIQKVTQRFADMECHPQKFPHQMDINCKVALITGGETGIGLAAANDFLTNGAQVVILAGVCEGETAVKQISQDHGEGRACFMHMDVNNPREFEELFYRVDLVFGGIDIVFNNAGIMQDQVWEYEVDTNLKSVIRGSLLALDYMGKGGKGKNKGGGIVINHSDVMALEPIPHVPGYVATKAGILGATRSFGSQYHFGKTGVRMVTLLSGPTETSMLRSATEKQIDPEWGRELLPALTTLPPQSPKTVGKAVSYLVKYAPPGSIWTVEHGELLITEIPSRHKWNTKVTQL